MSLKMQYSIRGELYFLQHNYMLSDKDYGEMINMVEGAVVGYMGIGRNAYLENRYEEVFEYFDYVLNLESDMELYFFIGQSVTWG